MGPIITQGHRPYYYARKGSSPHSFVSPTEPLIGISMPRRSIICFDEQQLGHWHRKKNMAATSEDKMSNLSMRHQCNAFQSMQIYISRCDSSTSTQVRFSFSQLNSRIRFLSLTVFNPTLQQLLQNIPFAPNVIQFQRKPNES
jgi:hypothetical protein